MTTALTGLCFENRRVWPCRVKHEDLITLHACLSRGGQRNIQDFLGSNHEGSLAILELKRQLSSDRTRTCPCKDATGHPYPKYDSREEDAIAGNEKHAISWLEPIVY